MNRKIAPLTVMGLFLAACGGAESYAPDVGFDSSEVIRGTPTSGTPAVVALYASQPGAEGGSLCTGTIVAPTVVLTAAHCVHPEMTGANARFVVFTGHNLDDEAARGAPLPVKEVHWNTSWDPNNLEGGHDIAVAILASPVSITPIPVNLAALPDSLKGKPARLIGYGLNDGILQQGAGVKRQATVKLNGWNDQFVTTGSWFGQTICSGDSGGPILMKINGVETVVGVNSYGLIFCLAEAHSTRPDANKAFVSGFLQ